MKSRYSIAFSDACKNSRPLPAPIAILTLVAHERGFAIESSAGVKTLQQTVKTILSNGKFTKLPRAFSGCAYFHIGGYSSFPWTKTRTLVIAGHSLSRNLAASRCWDERAFPEVGPLTAQKNQINDGHYTHQKLITPDFRKHLSSSVSSKTIIRFKITERKRPATYVSSLQN